MFIICKCAYCVKRKRIFAGTDGGGDRNCPYEVAYEAYGLQIGRSKNFLFLCRDPLRHIIIAVSLSKTFLIACGGTGGHLSPGIAVAQALTERGHRCRLLISQKIVDQKLCEAYPELTFIPISGVGFSGKRSNLPRCFWGAVKNILRSFRLLRNTKADAVIGFGGFTNVGIVLASKILHKPCFLHEANRIPGRAVRLLGRWATTVYVPEVFPDQPQLSVKVCGFPIRREFRKISKTVAKENLGFDPSRLLLVVVGGSQGARVLTQWAEEYGGDFKKHGIQLLCLTGVRNNAESASEHVPGTDAGALRNGTVACEKKFESEDRTWRAGFKTEPVATEESTLSERSEAPCSSSEPSRTNRHEASFVRFVPFCHQMHVLYSAADLVVGRAGAGTIAELTICETPSILIPLPTSADGHQVANARAFERQGGCRYFDQNELPKLSGKAYELLLNEEERSAMSERLRELQFRHKNAARIMVTDIERTLGIGQRSPVAEKALPQ